jgi:hypothetical protein
LNWPRRVPQFHHVVETTGGVVAPDLEDIHESFVRTGDRLELLNAFELALERVVVIEAGAMHHFDGAKRAEGAAGQPDFAVAPGADAVEEFMIGDNRDGKRLRRGTGASVGLER